MKIEYDSVHDLLYIWLGIPGEKAAKTETVTPGVHADFDSEGRLVGIEILEASDVLRDRVQFEVTLNPSPVHTVPA